MVYCHNNNLCPAGIFQIVVVKCNLCFNTFINNICEIKDKLKRIVDLKIVCLLSASKTCYI